MPRNHSENVHQKTLANFILAFVYEQGRVAPYEDTEDAILRVKSESVKYMTEHKKDWKIDDLLIQYKDIFYLFTCADDKYIGLTRNYAFINPRLVKCLERAPDKAKEAIIGFGKNARVSYVRFPEHVEQYREWEFAKVSLTLLEILYVIHKSSCKKREKIMFKRLVEKFENFSMTARTVLNFCYKGDNAEILETFLKLFNQVFVMEGGLVSVDMYLFNGVIGSYELDFLMSCAGGCLLNGMTSIADITNELTQAASRAKLKFTQVTNELVMSILESRKDFCFFPGDGSVWLSVIPKMSNDVTRDLINFFIVYINANTMHFTQSIVVIEYLKPSLLKDLQNATSIMVSAFLYTITNSFKFIDGNITLIEKESKKPMTLELIPIEVPTTPVMNTSPPTTSMNQRDGIGTVVEVGVKNVLIRFTEYKNHVFPTSFDDPQQTHAFCDLKCTMFGHVPVNDFSKHVHAGDYVAFKYLTRETIDIFYPIYNVVMNVSAFHDPATGRLIAQIDRSRSYQVYRNPPPVLSDESTDSDAENKPSTSKVK